MTEQKAQPGNEEKNEQKFEQALERLEKIVKEMEEGELSLEQMMTHFEEGSKLVKYCSDKLNEVERRIEILLKKGDEIVAEPFEPPGEGGRSVIGNQ